LNLPRFQAVIDTAERLNVKQVLFGSIVSQLYLECFETSVPECSLGFIFVHSAVLLGNMDENLFKTALLWYLDHSLNLAQGMVENPSTLSALHQKPRRATWLVSLLRASTSLYEQVSQQHVFKYHAIIDEISKSVNKNS
jgi:hypothetical protein